MELLESMGALHPIGVVARRTGLSLHVLRAWERRYGVVQPSRTVGGQRLYSDADVELLTLLRRLTEEGRSISQLAGRDAEELRDLWRGDVVAEQKPVVADHGDAACAFRAAALDAGSRMDGAGVHGALMRAVVSLRPGEFLDDVLVPVLHEVGHRWHEGRIGPAHEHVVSVAARRVLTWLLDAYDPPASAPLLLATTPAGEQHEFGAMLISALALEEGWRVEYLGPGLPADEIVRAVQVTRASAVALSLVNATPDLALNMVVEMSLVRRRLPASVTLFAGGAGAKSARDRLERAGVQVVTELPDVRSMLQQRLAG